MEHHIRVIKELKVRVIFFHTFHSNIIHYDDDVGCGRDNMIITKDILTLFDACIYVVRSHMERVLMHLYAIQPV